MVGKGSDGPRDYQDHGKQQKGEMIKRGESEAGNQMIALKTETNRIS